MNQDLGISAQVLFPEPPTLSFIDHVLLVDPPGLGSLDAELTGAPLPKGWQRRGLWEGRPV